jgi:hypothetical protein
MPWYSEKLTPMGRWSSQMTEGKPLTVTADGVRIVLRRVRELAPDEVGMTLDQIRTQEDARADRDFEFAASVRRERVDRLLALDPSETGSGFDE